MSLPHEHVGPTILSKLKIYILIRDNLLYRLCYEIPDPVVSPISSPSVMRRNQDKCVKKQTETAEDYCSKPK